MNESVGQRIARARGALGWTQSDLASAIGRSYNQVSAWERGDGTLRAPSLALLAGALGVTVTWLRDGDPVSPPNPAPGLHEARLRAVVEVVEALLAGQKRPSPSQVAELLVTIYGIETEADRDASDPGLSDRIRPLIRLLRAQ